MADYLENSYFQSCLVESHKNDSLTNETVKCFQLLIDHLSYGLPYKDEELRRDVKSHAMFVCCKNWKQYDMSNNTAFSYFTSTVLNGLRAGFKKYSKGPKGTIHISIESLVNAQNSSD